MKNKRGLLLMGTGLLLLAAALFLTVFNLCEERRAGETAEAVLEEMPTRMRWGASPEAGAKGAVSGELALPDYILDPSMDMPTVEIGGRLYVGVLEIPALELELPVMSQWDYANLKRAPCRYSGSVYLDNMVIAAHNYARHFGRLKTLEPGAEVNFTDADGNVFRYRAAYLEILMPTAVEEMETGDWDLTLFTCTVGGAYRVTLRCQRAEGSAGRTIEHPHFLRKMGVF